MPACRRSCAERRMKRWRRSSEVSAWGSRKCPPHLGWAPKAFLLLLWACLRICALHPNSAWPLALRLYFLPAELSAATAALSVEQLQAKAAELEAQQAQQVGLGVGMGGG